MGRIIAISDINGYHDEFVKLLKKVNFDGTKDKLVILGNFIDIGPNSFATLIKVKQLQDEYPNNVIVISGIHESMLKKSLDIYLDLSFFEESVFDAYAAFTKDNMLTLKTIDSFMTVKQKKNLLKWLDSLPILKMYKTPTQDTLIFTPCAIDANKHIDKQEESVVLSGNTIGKDFYRNPSYTGCITIFGTFYTSTIIAETLKIKDVAIWYDTKNYDKIGINCAYHYSGVMGALIYNEDTGNMDQIYYKKGE